MDLAHHTHEAGQGYYCYWDSGELRHRETKGLALTVAEQGIEPGFPKQHPRHRTQVACALGTRLLSDLL